MDTLGLPLQQRDRDRERERVLSGSVLNIWSVRVYVCECVCMYVSLCVWGEGGWWKGVGVGGVFKKYFESMMLIVLVLS